MNKSCRLLWLGLILFGVAQATPALTEYTYRQLTVVHELMAEGQYTEALQRLDVLLPKVKDRSYDYASVLQTYAHALAASKQFAQAIAFFDRALEVAVLPYSVQQGMRYSMAQLHAAIADYPHAAAVYEQWFALEEQPDAESFVFAASVYAQLQSYPVAIEKISRAIALSGSAEESWYQLLLAMHYRQGDFTQAAQTLEHMVALFPDNPGYWKQLSGVYFNLQLKHKALAVMELAHKRGFLETEQELANLVNLYRHQGIPYKAALLLETGMQSGVITVNASNLVKLGESWMAAREVEKALPVFERGLQYPESRQRSEQWLEHIKYLLAHPKAPL